MPSESITDSCFLEGFGGGIVFTLVFQLVIYGIVKYFLHLRSKNTPYVPYKNDGKQGSEGVEMSPLISQSTDENQSSTGVILIKTVTMSPETFQQKWDEFRTISEFESPLLSVDEDLEIVFLPHGIFCIASGTVDDQKKFYFYAQQAEPKCLFLCEAVIDTTKRSVTVKVKSESTVDSGSAFVSFVHQILEPLTATDV
eukprot:TRINITY_DN4911_c0_g1_i1.p1 TRINITY_DN4911_c0_g1~~TRINITY_DN4911_c0_g1_i1.p1  ORF type:complete len:198 (-),score=26.11 TRINITY_DN4911_c0_g1_i1:149-742(-)